MSVHKKYLLQYDLTNVHHSVLPKQKPAFRAIHIKFALCVIHPKCRSTLINSLYYYSKYQEITLPG